MKSVLRMSEQELAKEEAPGFTLVPAAGVSLAATVLAMAGMMLQYSPGNKGPLPGMDTFDGQLTIATGLGFGMFASAWMIRSVLMKRLQWAVLFSLVLHLVLCVTLKTVVVDVPVVIAAETGLPDRPLEQLVLPDYGGAESQNPDEQEWERPTEVDVPETEQQQLERQDANPEMQAEPDQVEAERQVQQAAVPHRQPLEQQMQLAEELELERQQQIAEVQQPEQVEAPEITTREVQQPDLQAQQMQRSDADLQNERREQQQLESQVDPTVKAVAAARREQQQADHMLQVELQQRQRELAQAEAQQMTTADVQVAAAAAAQNAQVTAQQLEAARQSQADLTSAQRAADAPASSAEMQVQSVAPSRSSGSAAAMPAAPSAGGAAAMSRASGGGAAAAVGVAAESVNVASAGGAAAARIAVSSSASDVARGSAGVPSEAAGGGRAPATQLSPNGVATLQSSHVGRGSGASSGPSLGESVDGGLSGRGESGSTVNVSGLAGGAGAQQVDVASAAGAAGSGGEMLAAGPSSSASNVGRGRSGLPSSGVASGGGTGVGPPSSSGSGSAPTIAMVGTANRNGGGELSGLGRNISSWGNGGGAAMSRRSAISGLPAAAITAEQSGTLVMAGPQAPAAPSGSDGGGGLSGPRAASIERRSSGLPGMARGPATLSRTRSRLPGSLAMGALPSRSRATGAVPKISSASEIASLVRRNVPGISAIPSERISAGFSMRTPDARAEAVRSLGGNDVSEAAVERGLEWLAAHQYAAGNWSIHNMNCRDHNCGDHGQYAADPAATGLALLAFLGAGHTHESGEYQQVVQLGLNWLLNNQKDDGDLFAADTEFAWFYSHGIASIALCEAYGMTKDRRLQQPAQGALNFIAASQQPEFGGWRYLPQFESDTSVSGWQLMALKSGQMAGLTVRSSTYDGVRKWLDAVESKEAPGRFAYHPTKEVTNAMTAEGLLMRQYLGAGSTDKNLVAGAQSLLQRLPRKDNRDAYYWYYGTQVMFHLQGEYWDAWNASLRDLLIDAQDKDGPTRGSWSPASPSKDKWGGSGGRHYITCMNLLMLEVYYRHLPLYIELN